MTDCIENIPEEDLTRLSERCIACDSPDQEFNLLIGPGGVLVHTECNDCGYINSVENPDPETRELVDSHVDEAEFYDPWGVKYDMSIVRKIQRFFEPVMRLFK